MRTLKLKRGEERRLKSGHLWIFSNEVDTRSTAITEYTPGEEVLVTDYRGTFIGAACVSPHSLICGRVYSREKRPLDEDLLRQRLRQALDLREHLYENGCYRMVFSEGDFLPGLVVDRFRTHLCLQVTTIAMEQRRDMLRAILRDLVRPSSLLWDDTVPARALEGLPVMDRHADGDVPGEYSLMENGCNFHVPALDGQKTGWFYDQRYNRHTAATLAAGRDVLDAFCYAGGFGVTCARAGARSVVYLDSSARAVSKALDNHHRNADSPCEGIIGDAFETLRQLREQGRCFDLVSIDPPAFIKRRRDFKEGLNAYRRLQLLAAQLVRDEGILVTSSCSQLLACDELRACVAQACAKINVHPRLLFTGHQGADHPVHCAMPETDYLKCLVVQCVRQASSRRRPARPASPEPS